MSLSKKLSCEAGSFSCHWKPYKFLQTVVLRLYFLTLEPWVVGSVLLFCCSSQFIYTQIWGHLVHQPPPCHASSLPWLPVSAPPTNLDEHFFFNSLGCWTSIHFNFLAVLIIFCFKICCCRSFDCARRQSVSTYASILVRSQLFCTCC